MDITENAALHAAWAARLRAGLREFLLYPWQTLRLGRAEGNDIIFDNLKISRTHAILEWNGTGFTLRDLGSANGTFVNDQRLSSGARLLRDGDQVRLGPLEMVYEIARVSTTVLEEPPVLHESEVTQAVPASQAADTVPEHPVHPTHPSLMVTLGPDMGQEYPLWGERVIIGRSSREATWEIRLTDRSVSRPHACLERHSDGGYYLYDLDSANGTLINGAPLRGSARLKDGDVIGVGETCLVLKLYLGLQAG